MAKKLPKRPKMPKKSASLATWEGYKDRVKEWKKKCADIVSAKKKKEAIIKAAISGK